MTPFWQDDHLTLYGGDCREVLRELPDESVHCVVTSPPYWGLRDYGTASWDGGDPECDHKQNNYDRGVLTTQEEGAPNKMSAATADKRRTPYLVTCGRCGARRIDSQLGLEATPEEFVANMVAVFREVRRVLRKDGTLWLNLGDSYAGTLERGESYKSGAKQKWQHGENRDDNPDNWRENGRVRTGLKAKDLCGIPWRVAFALQADGWYLRSDVIWAKPNPMPESVTDRPTKAHEYLFLLTRSPRYYYDAEAVREPVSLSTIERWNGLPTRIEGGAAAPDRNDYAITAGGTTMGVNPAGRNLRSVWSIATEPYPGAHFATFPRKLVEPCVKAGTSEKGVCADCGAPWVRVVEHTAGDAEASERPKFKEQGGASTSTLSLSGNGSREWAERGPQRREVGWMPTCNHCTMSHYPGQDVCDWCREGSVPVPAVVLDPFAGSGTTLLVAQALGRRGVGIDLSPDYLKQALERNRQTPLGLVG